MSDLKNSTHSKTSYFFSSITQNRNTALGLVEGWLIKYISEFKVKIYFSYDNIYTKHEQETETLTKIHMKIQKLNLHHRHLFITKTFKTFNKYLDMYL